MARAPRIQWPGATYHVINRGNYRYNIFTMDGSQLTFENCLFECCEKFEWIIHAYCLMSNHFHLAIETPRANLASSMQWLQSTYANRFNKYRKIRGHLFQDRYKSILIEKGHALGQLIHYIHLNPVRAKLINSEILPSYRWSSYWYLFHMKRRPKFLSFDACLDEAGDLKDTPRGRNQYQSYLQWLGSDKNEQRKQNFEKMCRGWILGSITFRKNVLKEYSEKPKSNEWGKADLKEMDELLWHELLDKCLDKLNIDKEKIKKDIKSAEWKIAIAAFMKSHSGVKNEWLAENLNMGKRNTVSHHVYIFNTTGYKKNRYFVKLKT